MKRPVALPLSYIPTLFLASLSLLWAGCGPDLIDRVNNIWSYSCCGIIIVVLDVIAIVEVIGSNRSFGSKLIWSLFIIFAPVLGCVVYYFFGRK